MIGQYSEKICLLEIFSEWHSCQLGWLTWLTVNNVQLLAFKEEVTVSVTEKKKPYHVINVQNIVFDSR